MAEPKKNPKIAEGRIRSLAQRHNISYEDAKKQYLENQRASGKLGGSVQTNDGFGHGKVDPKLAGSKGAKSRWKKASSE